MMYSTSLENRNRNEMRKPSLLLQQQQHVTKKQRQSLPVLRLAVVPVFAVLLIIILMSLLQCQHDGGVVTAFSVGNNNKNIIHNRQRYQMINNKNNNYKNIRYPIFVSLLQASRDDTVHVSSSKDNRKNDNNKIDIDTINSIDNNNNNNIFNYNKYFITPVQSIVDNVTNGWGLSYANLSPDNTTTFVGQSFLVSNIIYMIVGIILTINGDVWFGTCTELCAIASYNYHYQQLFINNNNNNNNNNANSNEFIANSPTVRLALLIDYIFALLSIGTATLYVITNPILLSSSDLLMNAISTGTIPSILYGVGISTIACICLSLSWVYEYGKPYMFWHSLWHIFSAYAGYIVGTDHLS